MANDVPGRQGGVAPPPASRDLVAGVVTAFHEVRIDANGYNLMLVFAERPDFQIPRYAAAASRAGMANSLVPASWGSRKGSSSRGVAPPGLLVLISAD